MPDQIDTRCCIAGGGPAGMMLGFLLARAGVDVVILEKHADFLRDFRGDTIHPSTLEIMHELGLLEVFLRLPHQELRTLAGLVGDTRVTLADFTHLPTRCKFVALMPQWDFLNFMAERARVYPTFKLMMRAEATDLIFSGERITGCRVQTPGGPLDIRAEITIGADGRHSTVRARANLPVKDLGAPMDVLWMRISRRPTDPAEALGHIAAGRMLVMIDRGDYWQCAFVIPKGSAEAVKQRGLQAFRTTIRDLAPWLGERVDELKSWDDIKLLTVAVDRLVRWHRPGLLCIGDAAHAMSPIGGVGINLAIQDAVAAANILAAPSSATPWTRTISAPYKFGANGRPTLRKPSRFLFRTVLLRARWVPRRRRSLRWPPRMTPLPSSAGLPPASRRDGKLAVRQMPSPRRWWFSFSRYGHANPGDGRAERGRL